jgi:hypothetical protein
MIFYIQLLFAFTQAMVLIAYGYVVFKMYRAQKDSHIPIPKFCRNLHIFNIIFMIAIILFFLVFK